MATQAKEKPKTTSVEKTNGEKPQSLTVSKTISREEAVRMLNEAETGEQDSGYLNFEPGLVKRVVFMGWKMIPGLGDQKGTEVPAAVFVTDSGKEQINADSVIVSYFKNQTEGCAREIVCTGVVQGKRGEYKNFEFYELNLKK